MSYFKFFLSFKNGMQFTSFSFTYDFKLSKISFNSLKINFGGLSKRGINSKCPLHSIVSLSTIYLLLNNYLPELYFNNSSQSKFPSSSQ